MQQGQRQGSLPTAKRQSPTSTTGTSLWMHETMPDDLRRRRASMSQWTCSTATTRCSRSSRRVIPAMTSSCRRTTVERMARADMLMPLDHAQIPNMKNIDPSLLNVDWRSAVNSRCLHLAGSGHSTTQVEGEDRPRQLEGPGSTATNIWAAWPGLLRPAIRSASGGEAIRQIGRLPRRRRIFRPFRR